MDLRAGTKLGPYEIVLPIGAGGMGQVYLATDSRLDRNVAIKVLSARMADEPQASQRFEREARAISGLSHPHICNLYDVGEHEGSDYLVMEHIEGETLAGRLKRGPLRVDEVQRLGVQIAAALDHAHRRGVVHRDLKPGNIMLTASGVKLLDFGLAKLSSGKTKTFGTSDAPLPTESEPLTGEGTIVGTLQYMAPEQLEGKGADARTDIFALGAVLYEMVTGQRAFEGENRASVIAAILEREPPAMTELAPMTPAGLDRLVRTCLAKDPEDRWQSARDLGRELKWVTEQEPTLTGSEAVAAKGKAGARVAWALAAVLFVALLVVGLLRFRERTAPMPSVRFLVQPPDDVTFVYRPTGHMVSVSPDGRYLAMLASRSGRTQVWVRALDSMEANPLAGTEGATSPFWSPDGRFIAYFAEGKLKKVPLTGGPSVVLCEAPGNGASGSWGHGGTILFSTLPARDGIYRVPASGGVAEVVVKHEENRRGINDYWPVLLPDGRHFLWLSFDSATGKDYIRAGSLDSRESEALFACDSRVEYVPPGYLLYLREGTLFAQPFDAEEIRFTGEAVPVAEGVGHVAATGAAQFSATESGVLAFQGPRGQAQLTWLDRSGRDIGLLGEPQSYLNIRLGPYEKRVALSIFDNRLGSPDLWIYDLAREAPTRFTFHPGPEIAPLWSPDGSELVYSSTGEGSPHMYRKSMGTEQTEEMLLPPSATQFATDWTSDGRYIVYDDGDAHGGRDLWLLPLDEGERNPIPLLQSEFSAYSGQLSPDDRWLAFVSDESGRREVYVQRLRLPGEGEGRPSAPILTGERQLISISGGTQPKWCGAEKELELVFVSGDAYVIAVPVKFEPTFEAGDAQTLFKIGAGRTWSEETYDVTQDGERFLAQRFLPGQMSASITVDTNWTARLKASSSP